MRISIKPDLIEAAIKLYAKRGGAHGIHTWQIAEQVGCPEPSLYRIFKNKDNLFYKSVATVVTRILKEFLYELHSNNSVPKDIQSVLLRWYESLSQDSARILYFAAFFSKASREQASAVVEQMVVALAKHFCEEQHVPERKATGMSRGLIYCLIHLKATQFPSSDPRLAEAMVSQWLKK